MRASESPQELIILKFQLLVIPQSSLPTHTQIEYRLKSAKLDEYSNLNIIIFKFEYFLQEI